MNIGEISKPSVDRALVKKKSAVQSTEIVASIEPTQAVSDIAEFSEESKQKSDDELSKKTTKQPGNSDDEKTDPQIKIDLKA